MIYQNFVEFIFVFTRKVDATYLLLSGIYSLFFRFIIFFVYSCCFIKLFHFNLSGHWKCLFSVVQPELSC